MPVPVARRSVVAATVLCARSPSRTCVTRPDARPVRGPARASHSACAHVPHARSASVARCRRVRLGERRGLPARPLPRGGAHGAWQISDKMDHQRVRLVVKRMQRWSTWSRRDEREGHGRTPMHAAARWLRTSARPAARPRHRRVPCLTRGGTHRAPRGSAGSYELPPFSHHQRSSTISGRLLAQPRPPVHTRNGCWSLRPSSGSAGFSSTCLVEAVQAPRRVTDARSASSRSTGGP
jgi:hypothetical protein